MIFFLWGAPGGTDNVWEGRVPPPPPPGPPSLRPCAILQPVLKSFYKVEYYHVHVHGYFVMFRHDPLEVIAWAVAHRVPVAHWTFSPSKLLLPKFAVLDVVS